MSITYPHRKKSQRVRSGDLGGQSRRCSKLFERPGICVYIIGKRDYTFAYGFARSTGSLSLNNHNEKNAPVVDVRFCCPVGVPIGTGRPYSGNGNIE